MKSSSYSAQNGGIDNILRPRPIQPGNPMVLRAQNEEDGLKPSHGVDLSQSSLSRFVSILFKKAIFVNLFHSGRSTPLPPDAPPSIKSISSARKQVRAQHKQRLFPTIDYAARVSHFDPKSDHRDFRGFFVLFWIGLAIMVLTTMLRNIKDTGYPLRVRVWALLTANTWQLGLSDIFMVGSTGLCLPMQRIFRWSNGWLRWKNCGMLIQSVFQLAWLGLWVKYVISNPLVGPLLTGVAGRLC